MIMKTLRSRSIVLLFFLLAFLFIVFDAAHAADDERVVQMKQEVLSLKEQRASMQKSEESIQQSLERSRNALRTTAGQGDQETHRIVRDAIAEAQDALDTVQNLRAKIESRMRSLETALRQPNRSREAGIATIAIGQVLIAGKSGQRAAEPGDAVFEGEPVATGRAGFCELYLPDGGYLMAGQESWVVVTEVDRANRILMADLKKGKVHVEKYCPESEGSRCWATRYSTGAGFLSFGGAELVYEQRKDGSEEITVLDGAAVFRDKQTRKATTLQVGDQLVVDLNGTAVVRKVKKENILSWWDPDIRVRM